MKNVKMTVWALAATMLMASCGESKKEAETEDPSLPMQNEMHVEDAETHSGNLDDGQEREVNFNDERIAAVYGHYSHIKTALVNTNAEEAQNGGELLVEALEGLESNDKAMEAANTIAASQSINEQRTAFLELSAAVEGMVNGAIESGEIYKQYCPMAFDGQGGSWLSSSEEVRNPYYGDKMLKCGSVRDTIR